MEEMYEAIYNYNNASYSITDTAQTHELLQNDPIFLTEYMAKNTNASILVSIPEQREINEDVHQEHFTWSEKSIKLFLHAYCERKEKFRDPKVKKKKLWHEIVEICKVHGYTNINKDILDRKMRNMKRSYKMIKENNKRNSTGRGRVSWEYYNIFEDIFCNDQTINHGTTLETKINASGPSNMPTSSQASIESIENEDSTNNSVLHPTHNKNLFSSTSLSDITNSQDISIENCLSPSSSTSHTSLTTSENNLSISESNKKRNSLYNQRKKQLEIEESRIKAIDNLKKSLDESNKIQQERNNLIKELILSQLNNMQKE